MAGWWGKLPPPFPLPPTPSRQLEPLGMGWEEQGAPAISVPACRRPLPPATPAPALAWALAAPAQVAPGRSGTLQREPPDPGSLCWVFPSRPPASPGSSPLPPSSPSLAPPHCTASHSPQPVPGRPGPGPHARPSPSLQTAQFRGRISPEEVAGQLPAAASSPFNAFNCATVTHPVSLWPCSSVQLNH